MAGSSVTVTKKRVFTKDHETFSRFWFEISWVADDTDGSVPDTVLTDENGDNDNLTAYIVLAVTNPGSTAPTNNYDITIEDSEGVDVMGGALADRSATASEQAMPLISGSPVPRLVHGPLTFKLTDNLVNSATGMCNVHMQQ